MIRLDTVTKRYGDKLAVDGLSLEVNDGEVCVLIGPSGCGKTTTLRMVNRLTEPTSGHIFVDGKDASTVRPERLRLSIGYAIQNVGLFPHLTVAENIAVVPQLSHWKKGLIQARVLELLRLVGLDPAQYAAKFPRQLSGGEAQRIGVARALAADPPILLMDEPFGAVDPLTRVRLQGQFLEIQRHLKKTVMLVTHDLDEAIRLADRIAIMSAGRLVQYDTPEAILSSPASKFVRDFVGADRALKRLSRIGIKTYLKPAPAVSVNRPVQEAIATAGASRWLWVTDDDRRLIGWVDTRALAGTASIREVMDEGDPSEIGLPETATLREALSRMLGQGVKYMPVIDEDRQLLGELSLRDVEAATTGPDEGARP
jgi:osmoprotectant transport system ATP-binding protein